MVYLDTSVVLAQLLTEDRKPPSSLWDLPLIASRLLEYEVWTRVNQLRVTRALEEATRTLLARIAILELIPEIVSHARDKLPLRVRTLDALHLGSAVFLIDQGVDVSLATYDSRMRDAAKKLRIPVHPLEL